MTRQDFIYAVNFPTLTDAQINAAYLEVSVMFSGVKTLWGVLDEPTRTDKRNLCMNLLTAWYLADMNPTSVTGVVGNGGMALSSKSIGENHWRKRWCWDSILYPNQWPPL